MTARLRHVAQRAAPKALFVLQQLQVAAVLIWGITAAQHLALHLESDQVIRLTAAVAAVLVGARCMRCIRRGLSPRTVQSAPTALGLARPTASSSTETLSAVAAHEAAHAAVAHALGYQVLSMTVDEAGR